MPQAQETRLSTLQEEAERLAAQGRTDESRARYEQALRLAPDDPEVLIAYGGLLSMQERPDPDSLRILARAVEAAPAHPLALAQYAVALVRSGDYRKAFPLYEKALQAEEPDFLILVAYGKALVEARQFEYAGEIFQRAQRLQPDDTRAGFWYASLLENLGQYQEAIAEFEQIDASHLPPGFISLLHFTLGRLYYRIRDTANGRKHFQQAVDRAPDRDVERLKIVRSIFEAEPDSEEGIALLKQAFSEADSEFAKAHARDLLASLLSMPEYFDMFIESPQDVQDMELLNRGIYHKIQNEISILKSIAYEIQWEAQETEAFLQNTIEHIESIDDLIRERRGREKQQLERISARDFSRLIDAIAATAHDISDTVNNEIAVIKGDLYFHLEGPDTPQPLQEGLRRMLEQIEFSESILNDLKSVNEGRQLKYSRFSVGELFDKWRQNPRLKNAEIRLDIENRDAEFCGDALKISGFLSELIENALNYNKQKEGLEIRIMSRDVPVCELFDTARGERVSRRKGRYLQLIVSDNGQGIPDDKKQWIFLPAASTGGSSGLGLFLIRKTLRAMKGFILEKGRFGHGAHFEICIPYSNNNGNHGHENFMD